MNVKLPNGAINWAKADPILIRMHNGGRPPADIGIEIGISTDYRLKRLHTLNKQGLVVYPNNKRRLTTSAEKAAIISEYPTCDTNELADRLGMTGNSFRCSPSRLGVLRDPTAASGTVEPGCGDVGGEAEDKACRAVQPNDGCLQRKNRKRSTARLLHPWRIGVVRAGTAISRGMKWAMSQLIPTHAARKRHRELSLLKSPAARQPGVRVEWHRRQRVVAPRGTEGQGREWMEWTTPGEMARMVWRCHDRASSAGLVNCGC